MEEGVDDIIFNIMSNEYNDKVNENKDLVDYLMDKTKHELLALYLLYGYAGNNKNIAEELMELRSKEKEDVINRIVDFLDNQMFSILQLINNRRMKDFKDIAQCDKFYNFERNNENNISLDALRILKQLNFIFYKKEEDDLIIHMPKFIRDKINGVNENLYLDYFDDIIRYSKEIVDNYGVINIRDAYDIIKKSILIDFEKYSNIIKFVCLLELEGIFYAFDTQCLCSFNLKDKRRD